MGINDSPSLTESLCNVRWLCYTRFSCQSIASKINGIQNLQALPATILNEIVTDKKYGIELKEEAFPVNEQVKSICEMLGLDPLYMANEGRIMMIVAKEDSKEVVDILRSDPLGENAQIVGEIKENNTGRVVMETEIGGKRIIDMLTGQQLPRIC